MNDIPSIPKEKTILKSSKQIFDFFQSKPIFTSQNLTKWRIEYKEKCHEKGISSYQTPISDFLVEKKFISFRDRSYSVINGFTLEDIVEVIRAFRVKNDAFNKKGDYKKTNIRRERVINKNGVNEKSNLIQKNKFLESFTTYEIIEYLQINRKIIIVNNQFYIPA